MHVTGNPQYWCVYERVQLNPDFRRRNTLCKLNMAHPVTLKFFKKKKKLTLKKYDFFLM